MRSLLQAFLKTVHDYRKAKVDGGQDYVYLQERTSCPEIALPLREQIQRTEARDSVWIEEGAGKEASHPEDRSV